MDNLAISVPSDQVHIILLCVPSPFIALFGPLVTSVAQPLLITNRIASAVLTNPLYSRFNITYRTYAVEPLNLGI